ncbi:MAG TPA: corrinoid protein [Burkholderiales bacterium]|nr:corrinoid protein [Burkholderiales bacterium]
MNAPATSEREEILNGLADSVWKLDPAMATQFAQRAIDTGMDAYEAINDGLAKGMMVVSGKFDRREYFVPELLRAAKAMNTGIDLLKPYLKVDATTHKGTVVIATVKGDIHQIGKNLVALMLRTAGFTVHDLGVNCPAEKYLGKAKEENADIIGMSALMTTTMLYMETVTRELEQQGMRERIRVMVGGAPVSEAFAKKVGADRYASHAAMAVQVAKELVAQKVA